MYTTKPRFTAEFNPRMGNDKNYRENPVKHLLSFFDKNNLRLSNVNYGIEIKQQDKVILENKNIYSDNGLSTLVTRPLNSEEPIIIEIAFNGIGMSENQEELTGPIGEIIMFTVVPEFGTITMMILALTIIAVIILNKAKKGIELKL